MALLDRLFCEGGESAGVGSCFLVIKFPVARALFKSTIQEYPERLITLRDRARVLVRSDRSEPASR